ncbi:DUF192 domain-containing protein [Natrarchaeobius sp. A-rgal3]|uniref:DUF192 domain-containing protein n=1 Tax=Natrarchaeobius versutus TaxID=1679078 RepID=UPI00351015C8
MTFRPVSSNRRTVLSGLAATIGIAVAGCLEAVDGGEQSGESPDSPDPECTTDAHEEYGSTEVRVTTPDGEELGAVSAAIADTPERKQLGLSDTESLSEECAMLFVYDEVDDRTFAMPEMSFGIDIVFADDEGVITEIHHAPEPGPDEDGLEQTYPGRGQYVLETVYEWTEERDVEEGDVLQFDQ